MKPQASLVAARRAAVHCPELLRTGPDAGELAARFDKLAARLIRALPAALAPLMGGTAPTITAEPAAGQTAGDLVAATGALAANSLIAAGAHDDPLLLSIEPAAVFRLVDRAFGGKGEAPNPLPSAFPLSAELMIARLEALVLAQLASALGEGEPAALRLLKRDGELAELLDWPGETPLSVVRVSVMEGMKAPWQLILALPLPTLAALFGHDRRLPAATGGRAANPAAAPFADVALPLSAVLVDMRLPLHAVSALEPGAVLPVAVARAVPLAIGGTVIARGTIGAQDDRVAVKLTHIA